MYVQPPPDYRELLFALNPGDIRRVLDVEINDPEYLHWDKLRHLPIKGLSHEEWWLRLKLGRATAQRSVPLTDPEGNPFTFTLPDRMFALLHHVDRHCSGEIVMEEVVTADEQARRRYLVNSVMEESIRSSQLEGATTSRKRAKELLETGRAPSDRSERMILNNYRALMYMRDDIGTQLSPDAVLELHRILTEGTLRTPDAAGRLQRPDEERVAVLDRDDGRLLHDPPPAEQLSARLQAFCDFANDAGGPDRFIHPVVKALLLHFWIGYDHPFEDGNGRTARALFYWSMRTQGYWLAEYLSISKILREAPSQYGQAFLYTETDDRDTTYFLLYQLKVIERAIEELHRYLRRKVAEVRTVESLLRRDSDLNHRQVTLLGEALRDADEVYTFSSHARSHGVTHETARSDLTALADRGLLERHRSRKQHRFLIPGDLSDRLGQAG